MPMDRPGERGEVAKCRYGKKKAEPVCQNGMPRNAKPECNAFVTGVNNGIIAIDLRFLDNFY